MTLLSVEVIKALWIGLALLSAALAWGLLFQVSGLSARAREVLVAVVALAFTVFVCTALNGFDPIEKNFMNWVFSTEDQGSLRLRLWIDSRSAFFILVGTLLMGARALNRTLRPWTAAAHLFGFVGVLSAAAAGSLWSMVLGLTAGVLGVAVHRMDTEPGVPQNAQTLQQDLIRLTCGIVGVWMGATALTVTPADSVQNQISQWIFHAAVLFLAFPWLDLGILSRGAEEGEPDGVLLQHLWVPSIAAIGMVRLDLTGTGELARVASVFIAISALVFFLGNVVSSSPQERRRYLGLLLGSYALASGFLMPGLAAYFAIGVSALMTGLLFFIEEEAHLTLRRVWVVFAVLIVGGLPAWMGFPHLARAWAESMNTPWQAVPVLVCHVLFMCTFVREAGLLFYRPASGTPNATLLVPHFLAVLFLVSLAWTGRWTGGLIELGSDQVPGFETLGWIAEWNPELGPETRERFPEAVWIQLALAVLWATLIVLQRNRDVFAVSPQAWTGFRNALQRGLGLPWFWTGVGRGFEWIGRRFEAGSDFFWVRAFPKVLGPATHGLKVFGSWMEARATGWTDERWSKLVRAPALLAESVTNGQIRWYLFMTVFGSFLMVLHFVLKIT